MITPKFPYSGSQVIVDSDRVVLHSKKEGIFLFGKATVGLSSPSTINLDTNEAVLVYSPKIYLGANANQRVVLGDRTIQDLIEVFTELKALSDALSKINESNFAASVPLIRDQAQLLSSRLNDKIITLPNNLSNVVYTE